MQKSVDRLGRAIEAAEEDMEQSLQRATQAYKVQLVQKDHELRELQQVVAGKENSIDSLRAALSETKRSYETRLAQLEAMVGGREGEVRSCIPALLSHCTEEPKHRHAPPVSTHVLQRS